MGCQKILNFSHIHNNFLFVLWSLLLRSQILLTKRQPILYLFYEYIYYAYICIHSVSHMNKINSIFMLKATRQSVMSRILILNWSSSWWRKKCTKIIQRHYWVSEPRQDANCIQRRKWIAIEKNENCRSNRQTIALTSFSKIEIVNKTIKSGKTS